MLQLGATLRSVTVRLTPLPYWKLRNQQPLAACSGAVNPSPVQSQPKEDESQASKPKRRNEQTLRSNNRLIQSVLESLKANRLASEIIRKDAIITTKNKAEASVDSLLKVADDNQITRDNALAVVTQLLDRVKSNKKKLSELEMDNRFLRLCALLSEPSSPNLPNHRDKKTANKNDSRLSIFYEMHESDEMLKDVANITVQQMIKVMTALAKQKRRITPLLSSLSSNISRSVEVFDHKQLSDLIYSMAVLNYPDEVLLQKVCADLIPSVKKVEKTTVIGSILTSLGMLRYKNEQLMDELSEWAVTHALNMRAQDLCSLFMTLAVLGHIPSNVNELNEIFIDQLKETDMTKPSEWLDIVWALTVLGLVKNQHIASVLGSNFIRKFAGSDEILIRKQLKLLNINGSAQFMLNDYKGPLLKSNSELFNAVINRKKDKEIFVSAVTATLDNIFPSPEYLKTNVNSGAGFLIDAEFCIDENGKRLPLESDVKQQKGFRIAVIAQDYHDFCRGKQDPSGIQSLFCRILQAKGYKILTIPHTEFCADDKIVQRIVYISDRIKAMEK